MKITEIERGFYHTMSSLQVKKFVYVKKIWVKTTPIYIVVHFGELVCGEYGTHKEPITINYYPHWAETELKYRNNRCVGDLTEDFIPATVQDFYNYYDNTTSSERNSINETHRFDDLLSQNRALF